MALDPYQLTERFETCGTLCADNINFNGDIIGSTGTGDTIAHDANGLLFTSGTADDDERIGLIPDATSILSATDFFKFSDQLVMEADIELDSALPIMVHIGWIDESPDGAGGANATNKQGGYAHGDVDELAGFWLDPNVSANWVCVYKGNNITAQFTTAVEATVSTKFQLRISVDTNRLVTFKIDGVTVHTTAVALDDVAVKPYAIVGGNAKKLYLSRIFLQKNY